MAELSCGHHARGLQIEYVGPPGEQKMMITIYYYGHDQSEERPVDEFFRGEHHSLIQWQPVAPMAQMPVGGMPMQGMPLQGMQVAGGMPMSMYAMAPPGDMVTAGPQLNQVRHVVHHMMACGA